MFNNNIYLFFNFLIVVLYCWGVTGIHVDHPAPEVKMHKRDLSHWGGKAIYLNKMPQKKKQARFVTEEKTLKAKHFILDSKLVRSPELKMCKGWLEALEWKSHLENVLFQQNTVKRRQASFVREFKIKKSRHFLWSQLGFTVSEQNLFVELFFFSTNILAGLEICFESRSN